MSAILRAEAVGKTYAGFQALKNVSFEVAPRETFAIIGPNGAGKTTLFKVLTGEVPRTTGRIFMGDREITRTSADQRVRMGLGRTFQIVRVFLEFTLMENLTVAIEARERGRRQGRRWGNVLPSGSITDEAYHRLAAVGIARLHATEARHIALGDRKRLELAMTLAIEPTVLMMDEPTAGMSPAERLAIIDLIQRTKEDLGLTILLTEHDMDFVFRLAETLMVMNQGEKLMAGRPDEVKASKVVQEIYLGKEISSA
ncbi:amino acid/amide ABC transporter ATP-binding protein 1, HAAT family [Rhizobiales bacterium GAS191]|nr:amino acid/amide ABC transporter ATP-binding protein 1, HAAT family [Rhizobiales bacterium GAS191]